MVKSRGKHRKHKSEPFEREAGIAFGLSCAAAAGVVAYDHFVDPFQQPALLAVGAFAATFLLCAIVPSLFADVRARRAARSMSKEIPVPPHEEGPSTSHEPTLPKEIAPESKDAGPPWPVIIAIGAIAFVIVSFGAPLVRRLNEAGVPPLLIEAFFVLAFGAISSSILLFWHRTAGGAITKQTVVTLVFLIVTVTSIGLLQPYVYELLERWSWPSDLLQDCSWLIALVLVGLPAERLGRRLGVTIERLKKS